MGKHAHLEASLKRAEPARVIRAGTGRPGLAQKSGESDFPVPRNIFLRTQMGPYGSVGGGIFHPRATFVRSVGEKSLPGSPPALRGYKGFLKEPRESRNSDASIRRTKLLQMLIWRRLWNERSPLEPAGPARAGQGWPKNPKPTLN